MLLQCTLKYTVSLFIIQHVRISYRASIVNTHANLIAVGQNVYLCAMQYVLFIENMANIQIHPRNIHTYVIIIIYNYIVRILH